MAQTKKRKRTKRKTKKTGGVHFRTLAKLPGLFITANQRREQKEQEREQKEQEQQERKNFSDLIPTHLPNVGILYFKILTDCRNKLKELYKSCNKNKNIIDENRLPIKNQIDTYIKKLRMCKKKTYDVEANKIKIYLLSDEYTKNIARLKRIEIDINNPNLINDKDLEEYNELKKGMIENEKKEYDMVRLHEIGDLQPLEKMKLGELKASNLQRITKHVRNSPRYKPLAPNSLPTNQ